ncbi:MAG: tRNA (adenosine(37)-N6)-threonylcarbamoyltransferase complex dimerization subunit type 1 TsaB [Oscillospiraceae bacterium]|nr:tRNA (adenosine(37)-N6)-threonylcarbamoyltransferase complex dimerization subunit type 1 TsaB [Oscillospiraceae bacterium]
MKLLALESSAKAASCAVLADGEVLASAWQAAGLTHSRTLLPMAEAMLQNSGLTVQDMDAIAVAAGPGSFTGLRIGAAAAKGLAWAAEKPCVPVSTLEAMAWPLAHLEGNIVCAMDARRQQIYNAVFLAEGGTLVRLREDRAVSLEEAAADLAGLDGPMFIVGDGARLCFDFLQEKGVPCHLAPGHLRLQSAVGVGLAAWRRWPEGAVSAQELVPVYLRLSQAERERLERGQNAPDFS